jgi:AcrR family transcriptional regulator
MTRKPKPQLTPQDWIKAAFRALAREGVGSIKAETLAKTLKATKGSFYWHFKDVPSFRHDMLALWEADATTAIMVIVDNAAAPGPARLSMLSDIVSSMNADNEYGGLQAEPSIRDWARTDRVVLAAVKRVDQRRISYVTRLFGECGFGADLAQNRALLFYGGFVGLQTLSATTSKSFKPEMEELLRLILAA